MKRTAPKFGLLTLCNVGYIWETIYILGSILTGGKRSQLHNYDIVCFDSKITLPSSGDYKLSFITFHLQKVVCNTRMRKYKIWDLPWLGDNLIRSKDPHPVKRSLWLFLRWQLAANDLVLLEHPLTLHFELQNKISALQHEIQKGKGSVWAAEQWKHVPRFIVFRVTNVSFDPQTSTLSFSTQRYIHHGICDRSIYLWIHTLLRISVAITVRICMVIVHLKSCLIINLCLFE